MALIPENLNPLSPNGFQFSIQKLPELTYFAQQVSIPGISLPNTFFNTPFSQVKVAGDVLTYESLNVEFLVDEKMSNYLALYDWIIAMGFPENYDQYISWQGKFNSPFLSEIAKNFSDATLTILGSNNVPIQTITFVDLIPTNLSQISLTTTSTDVNYITCTATFEYSYYKFV